ncbi:MAG: zinc transporter ZntB [Kiritimatiellae bacterium]|nr:zinc transporter ZntB [Kiritimatiellia bacterium]
MSENQGIIFAFNLDGQGGGQALDFKGLRAAWPSDSTTLWAHLNYTCADTQEWLYQHSGLDPVVVEALTAGETRPRSLIHKGGMLVILRGVNLSPETTPDDMISIRIWIDARHIITLRNRHVMAVDELRRETIEGYGPESPGGFLVALSDRLVNRMGDVVVDLEDLVDALEDEVLTEQNYALRKKIAGIRRTAIGLRRYLAPQRDVMARLYSELVEWLSEMDRMRLRETGDRTTRYVEDLDALRERASVTQEELDNRLAEQMNKTMYVLSIVAGIFLPLSLLTGIFGINVGGMPGINSPWAFCIFCVVLAVVAALQVWLFKRMKWM